MKMGLMYNYSVNGNFLATSWTLGYFNFRATGMGASHCGLVANILDVFFFLPSFVVLSFKLYALWDCQGHLASCPTKIILLECD